MARRRDSPQLQAMRAKLQGLEAQISEMRLERDALRKDIAEEQTRLTAEATKSRAGLALNVTARWDQNMTAAEIATALGITRAAVERILAEQRHVDGVTVRRGRKLKENRKVRD